MRPRGRSKGQTNRPSPSVQPDGVVFLTGPAAVIRAASARAAASNRQTDGQTDGQMDGWKVREACWLLSRRGRVAGNSGSIEGTS